MNLSWIAAVGIIFSFSCCCSADIVKYQSCSDHELVNCAISELRINPCPEAESNKPCILTRGKVAEIEFDLNGKAGATELTTKAYWATEAGDLPLVGMDTDGCAHTTCPVTGEKQTFKYDLEMSKKFPARSYNVKWKLWKGDDMKCCLIFKIVLKK